MFFFFFGDIQQRVNKVIERSVALCPRCGTEASLVEYDNVFRAFFIPIWSFGGSNPAIHCDECGFLNSLEQFQKRHPQQPRLPSAPQQPRLPPAQEAPPQIEDLRPSAPLLRCWSCSGLIQPEFQFCPQCGVTQT